MCELCQHEEALPGRKLCAVCGEAILRLANAVSALGTQAIESRPMAISASKGVEDYRTACFGDGD